MRAKQQRHQTPVPAYARWTRFRLTLWCWCVWLLVTPDVLAQGRPDIRWMIGGHTASVVSVAYSPDGQYLASAGHETYSATYTIKLWRVSDGRLVRTLTHFRLNVRCLAFSPDGQYLVSGGMTNIGGSAWRGEIRLWRVADGLQLRTAQLDTYAVNAVTFLADGEHLAIATTSSTILWNIVEWRAVFEYQDSQGNNNCLALSPDGQILAAGHYGNFAHRVLLWNAISGELIGTLIDYQQNVASLAFSPNGQWLAAGGWGEILVWRTSDWSQRRRLRFSPEWIHSVAFSPDSQYLAAAFGYTDRAVRIWRTSNWQLVSTLYGHNSSVLSVAFSIDGQYLASSGSDRTVRLWRVGSWTLDRVITGLTDPVFDVSFSPDGRYLAACSGNKAYIWRVSNGSLVHAVEESGAYVTINAVAFSPNSEYWATAVNNGQIKLWRVADWSLVRSLVGHRGLISSIAFSPDGQYIASGGWDDRTVRVWQVTDGTLLWTFQEYNQAVSSVKFSPNGEYLATGCLDGSIKLWRMTDRSLAAVFWHTQRVTSVDFSPYGLYLVSSSSLGNDNIKVWRLVDQALIHTFQHNGALSVVFAPGGMYFASVGWDATIRFWNIGSDAAIIYYDQETGTGCESMHFSLNGRLFAVGRADATLMVARNPFWQQGDTDGNGCVNDADLLQVLFAFGQTGVNLSADMNEDGIIDDADLLIVLFAFGEGC